VLARCGKVADGFAHLRGELSHQLTQLFMAEQRCSLSRRPTAIRTGILQSGSAYELSYLVSIGSGVECLEERLVIDISLLRCWAAQNQVSHTKLLTFQYQ